MKRKYEKILGVFLCVGAVLGVTEVVWMLATFDISWNRFLWYFGTFAICGFGAWKALIQRAYSSESN